MTTLSPPTVEHSAHDYDQLRPGLTRPRAVSSMSTASAASRRSKDSKKLDLTESSKEKRRLNTKADPSKALAEATPAEIAQSETTIDNLRRLSVNDSQGNRITEPDRSNPTRYRFERPLDTIRSFNAAAEGTSYRRSSYHAHQRSGSQFSEMGGNRHSGYYNNNNINNINNNNGHSPMPSPRGRPGPHGGYYRNSYGMGAPVSVVEDPQESQYYNGHSQGPGLRHGANPYSSNSNGHHASGPFPQESPISGSPRSNQPSYETMTNGSDAENGKSTNPSSLNSSYDQIYQLRKPDNYGSQPRQHEQLKNHPYANDQSFGGWNHDNYRGGRSGPNGHHQQNPSYGGGAYGGPVQPGPAPPPKESSVTISSPRQPIKLDGGATNSSMPPTAPIAAPEGKKGGWLKRTFSRKA